MANKNKNLKKQNIKKAQKQKRRQEKLKKQSQPPQAASAGLNVAERVDYALDLLEKGDLRAGKKMLHMLERKHPDHALIHYGFGVVAGMENRLKDAVSCFEKAVEILPDFMEAQYNLGVAYQNLYKIPEMVYAFRKVVKLGKPSAFEVSQAKGMLESIEKMVQKDSGHSLDDYLRANEFFEQGVEEMESEHWEESLAAFEKTLELHPNHTQTHGNMGLCYAFLGKKQQALDAFDRALALDPKYELAQVNRAMVEAQPQGKMVSKKGKSMEYYKDYPMQDRSYVQDFLMESGFISQNDPAYRVPEGAALSFHQYNITEEPIIEPYYEQLPAEVKDRLQELMVTAQDRPAKAIPELEELKEKYPHVPHIYNFLAVAYSGLGDMEKTEAIVKENLFVNPDYLFGKLNYAQLCLANEEHEKILEIFDNKFDLKAVCPEREKFHITEFVTFCGIMGKYFMMIGKPETARNFNKFLQDIAPHTPTAKELKRLVN